MVVLESEVIASLQARASTGRLKFWEIYLKSDENGDGYFTVSANELADGGQSKAVQSAVTYAKPKNVGKANETSTHDQAMSEIQSHINKKKDKGYWPVGEPEPKMRELPMLAQSYDKHSKKIQYPAYVQPKADGVRCLTDGKTFWSRGGKDFPAECVQHLQVDLPEGVILDGELMLSHDDYTFQQTVSATKKYKPLSRELKLHVYDLIHTNQVNLSYGDRAVLLFKTVSDLKNDNYVKHPTLRVTDEKSMKEIHGEFISDGWEGTIIRNKSGAYKVNGRSYDLQKYKEFLDDEFEIVGVRDGVGKFEGHAVIRCRTDDGKEFECTPKADMATRKVLYDNRDALIGKMYTVRFQEYTDDGIPRFPIGIEIRDYE